MISGSEKLFPIYYCVIWSCDVWQPDSVIKEVMCIYLHSYMYVCVCICVCIYICVCVCICIYVCAYVYIYVCVCVHRYICVCMYMCMCVCTCICVYVYMYVCVCTCICVCMCITYIYIYICVYVRYVQKTLRMELYLPRQKWTITERLIFFKIVPLTFNKLIPNSFLLVKAPLKFLSWYSENCTVIYFFDGHYVLQTSSWDEISASRTRKNFTDPRCLMNMESVACVLQKKLRIKTYQELALTCLSEL